MISSFTGEYRFLSNFYPINLVVKRDDVIYNFHTLENAYQAMKCADKENIILFTNPRLSPGEAKQLGKNIRLTSGWNGIKIQVMENLLNQKFDKDRNPELYWMLQSTKPKELIEGNHWGDTFWGVCNNRGHNHLGKLLMKIRDGDRLGEFYE